MRHGWDKIEIGPTPAEEDAAQIGQPGFSEANRRECAAFIEAIRRKLGPEPDGARLLIFTERGHDYGNYREVNCEFDPNNSRAVEYAYHCEGKAPTTWEEVQMSAAEVQRNTWRTRFGTERSF